MIDCNIQYHLYDDVVCERFGLFRFNTIECCAYYQEQTGYNLKRCEQRCEYNTFLVALQDEDSFLSDGGARGRDRTVVS